MRGLLDALNSEEGQMGLALLAAAGPQAQPMSFGQRLQGAMGQMQAQKDAKEDRALKKLMTDLQMQGILEQQAARKDGVMRQQARQGFLGAVASGAEFNPAMALQYGLGKDEIAALTPKAKEPIKLGAGDVLVDPTTFQPQFTAPTREPSKPSDVQQYEFAQGQGYKGSFLDFQKELKRAGASSVQVQYGAPVAGQDAKGNPIFFQPSKDGGQPAIIPGVAPPRVDKPLTEAQAKAQTFFGQMTTAENFYRENDLNPESLPSQVAVSVAGGKLNIAAPAGAQKAKQAQDQWSEAYLRFKTGAAATKDEVVLNNRTFFPVIGDSPEVIEQKRLARESAMRDIQAAATGKAGEVPALKETKGQTTFKMLPPANQYPGKRMRADNGTIYRSDGTRWVQE